MTYSFVQLKEWYDQVWTRVLEIPGAVWTDIDEVRNGLSFGVENEAAGKAVDTYLRTMPLPEDSYAIKYVDAPQLSWTLQEEVRPLRGGLKIQAYDSV